MRKMNLYDKFFTNLEVLLIWGHGSDIIVKSILKFCIYTLEDLK
jgi:hypothetical protein